MHNPGDGRGIYAHPMPAVHGVYDGLKYGDVWLYRMVISAAEMHLTGQSLEKDL